MREAQRLVDAGAEEIEIAPGLTDRKALKILEANDEFLEDLDACPIGRAA